MRGYLTVDYSDSDQSTYKGLNIHFMENGEDIRFDIGDPLIDWYNYCKFMFSGEAVKKGIESISHSSNVDHWFMDGDKYSERYFDPETLQFISNDVLMKMPMSEWDQYPRCVVTDDMKDFNDLKIYYKSKTETK